MFDLKINLGTDDLYFVVYEQDVLCLCVSRTRRKTQTVNTCRSL